MKQIGKITGVIILALAMLVCMATTAFATKITIDGGVTGSEYAAYKLLTATDGGNGKFAYTLNEDGKYVAILQAVTGKTEQADIISYIEALDTAEAKQEFANAVYAAIVEGGVEADYTTDNDVFADVAQGYYLVAETKLGNEQDTFSLVILETAGLTDLVIDTKESVPEVEKKVEEKNDSTGASSWGDHADYDIGDSINFRITGTVSAKYADYQSYYYSFVDTMDAGLSFNKDENGVYDVKVYVVNGDEKVDVTEEFVIAVDEESNKLTATSNLKELTLATVSATSEIVVEYSATLNNNATIGATGNENEVYLEYENSPYHEADGDSTPTTPNKPDAPSSTPKDVNVVFTFKADVDKTDKDGNALAGAGFTLYKEIYTPATETTEASYDWVKVGEEVTGVTTFNFIGLDAGKYKLEETTVPAGYNKCDDIVFEVVAEYDTATEVPALTGLSVKNGEGEVVSDNEGEVEFTVDVANGAVSTDVVNLSGSELPSTGGIGTTIFYILGGVLLVVGVVALVAKKRMGGSDN